MTALTDDHFSSSHTTTTKPTDLHSMRLAAWATGGALIVWGVLGLSFDRSLFELDAACLWVGSLALPPVTDRVRRAIPIGARAHAIGGTLCLAMCFCWALVAPPERTAAHFAALQQNVGDVGKVWAQLPDFAAAEAVQKQAEAAATKQTFLSQLNAATAELQGGVQPASFIGGRDTVMEGARALAAWRALANQARSMQLSEEEAAHVKAFQSLLAVENAELGPSLRQSYAVSLRDELQAYGVTAHVLGAGADTIVFNGAALSDPAVQTKLRLLLGKDMATLGYKSIEFAADGSETHAASEPTQDLAKS